MPAGSRPVVARVVLVSLIAAGLYSTGPCFAKLLTKSDRSWPTLNKPRMPKPPPMPPPAYRIFFKEMRLPVLEELRDASEGLAREDQIKLADEGFVEQAIMSIVAERWRNLPSAEKEVWYERAEQIKKITRYDVEKLRYKESLDKHKIKLFEYAREKDFEKRMFEAYQKSDNRKKKPTTFWIWFTKERQVEALDKLDDWEKVDKFAMCGYMVREGYKVYKQLPPPEMKFLELKKSKADEKYRESIAAFREQFRQEWNRKIEAQIEKVKKYGSRCNEGLTFTEHPIFRDLYEYPVAVQKQLPKHWRAT